MLFKQHLTVASSCHLPPLTAAAVMTDEFYGMYFDTSVPRVPWVLNNFDHATGHPFFDNPTVRKKVEEPRISNN